MALGLWEKKNKRNVFFIAEPEGDFFCFISLSLGATSEF